MPTFIDKTEISARDSSQMGPEDSDVLSKGFTPKSMMQDQNANRYLAKSPDPLSAKEVFRGYIADDKINEDDPTLKAHIFSLEFEGAFLELLIPNFMASLFGDLLVVPEIYLHVTDNNQIIILSKILNGFDEFLHHKLTPKFGNLLEKDDIPNREQLGLTQDEAFYIGQLYAAALIFNHWDILNSKLLNSGVINSSERTQACIVDFGFSGHLSYKGRHNDSLSIDDENFVKGKKISYRFFTNDYLKSYRHRFALPFDSTVGSLIPHTLIEDLFNLSGHDLISIKMREGFASMVNQATARIQSNPKLYESVFNHCLTRISNESKIQPKDLPGLMNMSYYKGKLGDDNLFTIIFDRVLDCQRLLDEINHGVDMIEFHEQSRDKYVSRNSL